MTGILSFVLLLLLAFYAATGGPRNTVTGVNIVEVDEPSTLDKVIESADVVIEEVEAFRKGTEAEESEPVCMPVEEPQEVEETVPTQCGVEKARKVFRVVKSKPSCPCVRDFVTNQEEEVIVVRRPRTTRYETCKKPSTVPQTCGAKKDTVSCVAPEELPKDVPSKQKIEEKMKAAEEPVAEPVEELPKETQKVQQDKKLKPKSKQQKTKPQNNKQKGQKTKKQSKSGKAKK